MVHHTVTAWQSAAEPAGTSVISVVSCMVRLAGSGTSVIVITTIITVIVAIASGHQVAQYAGWLSLPSQRYGQQNAQVMETSGS